MWPFEGLKLLLSGILLSIGGSTEVLREAVGILQFAQVSGQDAVNVLFDKVCRTSRERRLENFDTE